MCGATTAGQLKLKGGSLTASFSTLRDNVQQAALSGNRIGALSNGHFFVKEGAIGVIVNENAGGFPAYRYRVKEGALDAAWVVQQQAAAVPHIAVPLVKPDVVTTSSGAKACAGLCNNPTAFTINGTYSGQLGTGAVCLETTSPVNGGNCGNITSPRVLKVNGTTMTCNGQNWSSVPAARNNSYCIHTTAGQQSSAFVTLW